MGEDCLEVILYLGFPEALYAFQMKWNKYIIIMNRYKAFKIYNEELDLSITNIKEKYRKKQNQIVAYVQFSI